MEDPGDRTSVSTKSRGLKAGWWLKNPLKNVPNHKPESHRKSLEKNAGHATQGHHIGQRTFIRTFQGVSEFIGL
jgi:hypothetical protein